MKNSSTLKKAADWKHLFLLILVLVLLPFPTHAGIDEGVSWLESKISAEGDISADADVSTRFQSTVEASLTLLAHENNNFLAQTKPYVNSYNADGAQTENFARQVLFGDAIADNISALIESLSPLQNIDGGFGDHGDFHSQAADTAYALLALSTVEPNNSAAAGKAIAYLLRQQADDGGFRHSPANSSSVFETALASLALQKFRFSYNLTTAIDSSTRFLISQQHSDHSWGATWETAYALLAIIPVTLDTAAYQSGLELISATQLPNGSWNNSVYDTALALRALKRAEAIQLPADNTLGTYTGKVINAATGQTIQGAAVKLPDDNNIETTADANGDYVLSGVTPGEHDLTFSAPGFTTATKTANAVAGQFTSVSLTKLTPLSSKGRLFGIISDAATGQPLDSANLTVSGSTVGSILTDNNGYFSLEVEPGNISLAVSATGYDAVSGSAQVVGGQEINFSPALYATGTSPGTLTAITTLTVIDAASSTAIEGVSVAIVGSQTTGSTNSEGKLTFDEVTAGSVSIDFSANGYLNHTANVILPAGTVTDLGIIRLTKQTANTSKRTLSGRVKEIRSQDPIPGATVKIQGSDITVLTDNDGHYYIDDVGQAEATIVFSAVGYLTHQGEITFEQPGHANLNVNLSAAEISQITISGLSANGTSFPAKSEVELEVGLTNSGNTDEAVHVYLIVINSRNEIVAQFPGKTPPLGNSGFSLPVTILSESTIDIEVEWYTELHDAGQYQIKVQAIDLNQQLLSERSLPFTIEETTRIAGSATFDPPITQWVAGDQVKVEALVQNTGNQVVPAGDLTATVTLEVQGNEQISYGEATVSDAIDVRDGRKIDSGSDGSLYIADANGKVLRIAPSGATTDLFSELNLRPVDVDVATDGKVYVLSLFGEIYAYDPSSGSTEQVIGRGHFSGASTLEVLDDGRILVGTGSSGLYEVAIDSTVSNTLPAGLASPYGLVQDSAGRIFIPDAQGIVYKYENGSLSRYLDTFQSLRGIAIDALDNLYISDFAANKIYKVTPSAEVSVLAEDVNTPWGLSYDNINSRLLVASNNGDAVIAINVDGSKTTLVDQTINQPSHVVYDASGNSYAVDAGGNIVVFDTLKQLKATISTGLSVIRDMTFDPSQQRLLVLANGVLYAISLPDGEKEELATGLGSATTIKPDPNGGGYLLIESNGNISRIALDGTKESYIQPAFDAPIKMLKDAQGNKYILNSTYITKIALDGKVSRLADGLFNAQDLALSSTGTLLVANVSTRQVLEVDAQGNVTEKVFPDFFAVRLATDDQNNLYMLQSDKRTIHKLDASGAIQVFAHSADFQIDGMTVAKDGVFWVYHRNNSRVSKVSNTGIFETFSNVQTPTAISSEPDTGVWVATGSGLVHIANDGQLTDLLTGSEVSNQSFLSVVKGNEGDYWLLAGATKLLRINSVGNVVSTYASLIRAQDLVFADNNGLIVVDQSMVLTMPAHDQLATILTTGSYSAVNIKNNQTFLLAGSSVGTVNNATGEVTSVITGIRPSDLAINPVTDEILIASRLINNISYYDFQGSVTRSHTGLVTPTAILVTTDGKVLVTNQQPRRLMEVASNGELKEFSTIGSIEHLSRLPNGQVSAADSSRLFKLNADGSLDGYIDNTNSFPASAWNSDGSGSGFAIIQRNKLAQIDSTGNATILAAGIGNIVDIEANSSGEIYLLDKSRQLLHKYTANGALELVSDDVTTSSVALTFSTDDEFYVTLSSSYIGLLDTTSGISEVVAQAPVVNSLSGITVIGNELIAVNQTGNTSLLYTVSLQKSGVINPGTIVYSKTVARNSINVGSIASLVDFGSFSPPSSGDYKVSIKYEDTTASGALNNTLHVGGAAIGNVALNQDQVFPGDQSVMGSISVIGADSTTITQIDAENTVLAASTGADGRGVVSDRAGNIYAAAWTGIIKTTPDGVVSTFANIQLSNNLSSGLVIDSLENIYAVSAGGQVFKVSPEGTVSELSIGAVRVNSIAIDYDDNLFALNRTTNDLIKIEQNGQIEVIMTGLGSSNRLQYLAIDVNGDFYSLIKSGQVIKFNPKSQTISNLYSEPDLFFEFEGQTITTDCSNNILIAPIRMPSIGLDKIKEESYIVQVTGNTRTARTVFYGPPIDSALGDMDVLNYDRFNNRLLIYSDFSNGKIFSFPIICGGIDAEAHIVSKQSVDINGFDPAPTRTETLDNGDTKYVWILSQVDFEGVKIDFSAQFAGLTEGEQRGVFKEAYLLFTNSFVPGQQVKTPLNIPTVLAGSRVSLDVSLDKAAYLSNDDVTISLPVANNNDSTFSGKISLTIMDDAGVVVEQLPDVTVTDVPALNEVIQTTGWNTGLTLVGNYKIQATLYNTSGSELDTSEVTFAIQANETATTPRANLRLTVDKPIYNISDQVVIGNLAHNVTANVLIKGAQVRIKLFAPDNSLLTEASQTIGDLAAGNQRQSNILQTLSGVAEGQYKVSAELVDADGNVLATDETQFQVQAIISSLLTGAVQLTQDTLPIGSNQTCSNTINNQSAQALSATTFRQILVNLATGDQTTFDEVPVPSISANGQHKYSTVINTNNLAAGGYSCVLQYQEGDEWETLAYAIFTLEPQAIDIQLSGTLETAEPSLIVGSTQTCTSTLKNTGSTLLENAQFRQILLDSDNSSTLLKEETVDTLGGSNTHTFNSQFDTSSLAPGAYQCVLQHNNNGWENLASAPFELTEQPAEAIISGTLTAGQSTIEIGQEQTVSGLIQNTGEAALGSTLFEQVLRNETTGSETQLAELNIESLAVGAQTPFNTSIATSELAAGQYSIALRQQKPDGSRTELAKVFFTLESVPEDKTIVGEVTVAQATLTTGAEQICSNVLDHIGNTPSANALFRQALVNPDGETDRVFPEQSIDNFVNGTQQTFDSVFNTTNFSAGSYTCVLEQQIEGNWTPLANASFQVEEEVGEAVISGSVQVEHATLAVGVEQTCTNLIQNTGDGSLESGLFRQILRDADGTNLTVFAEQTIENLESGKSTQFVTTIATTAMDIGQYSCVLQQQSKGEWDTLSQTFFTLEEDIPDVQLIATTVVNHAVLISSTEQTCDGSIKNIGSQAFEGGLFRLALERPGGDINSLTEQTIDRLESGATKEMTALIDTTGLQVGDYNCLLQQFIE